MTDELSQLIQRAHAGDEAARERLFAVAYDDLRGQARAQLRDGGRNTLLNTTVLLHESFLRFQRAGKLAKNAAPRRHPPRQERTLASRVEAKRHRRRAKCTSVVQGRQLARALQRFDEALAQRAGATVRVRLQRERAHAGLSTGVD